MDHRQLEATHTSARTLQLRAGYCFADLELTDRRELLAREPPVLQRELRDPELSTGGK
ncbi:hypothetical protein SH449x_005458 [Pirellulaceae bacterium SH449]